MVYRDDPDLYGNDDPLEEDMDEGESISFKDRVEECPNCKNPVTTEMDSCPYCGDILFRYLKDATYIPQKGPLAKFVSVLILLLIGLGVVGFMLFAIGF